MCVACFWVCARCFPLPWVCLIEEEKKGPMRSERSRNAVQQKKTPHFHIGKRGSRAKKQTKNTFFFSLPQHHIQAAELNKHKTHTHTQSHTLLTQIVCTAECVEGKTVRYLVQRAAERRVWVMQGMLAVLCCGVRCATFFFFLKFVCFFPGYVLKISVNYLNKIRVL